MIWKKKICTVLFFICILSISSNAEWRENYECETGNCTITVRTVNSTSGSAINSQICNVSFWRNDALYLEDSMQNETGGFHTYDFNETTTGTFNYAVLCIYGGENKTISGVVEVTGVSSSLFPLIPLIISILFFWFSYKVDKESNMFMHLVYLAAGFAFMFGSVFIGRQLNPTLQSSIDILIVPMIFVFVIVFFWYFIVVFDGLHKFGFGGGNKKYGL